MSSFEDIPIKDIDYLLSSNNLPLSGNKYLNVWNFIKTNPNILVPKSIADWINTYNLSNNIMNFPDEIIAKILSDFDCDQILSLCKLNKRFDSVCNIYRRSIFDKFLLEEDFNLTDYNPRIICKALKINQRISCNNTFVLNGYYYETAIIIDYNGKVIISSVKEKFDANEKERKNKILGNAKNIVSVIYSKGTLLLLDSFGDVFTTETSLNAKEIYEFGELVFEEIRLLSPKRKNIIQIGIHDNNIFALDLHGNVFVNYDEFPILGNVRKIVDFIPSLGTVFLTLQDGVYTFNSIHRTSLEIDLKNVKDIIKGKLNDYYTITHDNMINRYYKYHGYGDLQLETIFIPNIDIIIPSSSFVFVLTNDKKLYIIKGKEFNEVKQIMSEVKDINVSDNDVVLNENGELILYDRYSEEELTAYDVGTNVKLLQCEYILKDGKIYSINIIEDASGDEIELEEIIY